MVASSETALGGQALSLRDKPDACYEMGCPLAEKGRGFVLGTGDPRKAKIALILEAPGSQEIQFPLEPMRSRRFLDSPEDCKAELDRRRRRYPDIPIRLLKTGAPIVGDSGHELNQWVFPATGLQRDELFVDNTLRCLPPKNSQGAHYPKDKERKEAERCCRRYDRLDEFAPEVLLISLHPAGILREVTPLPLQIVDFKKAKDFAAQGAKVAVLAGGKAAKAFARHGENVTKFRGSYLVVGKDWGKRYRENFIDKAGKKAQAVAALDAVLEPPSTPPEFSFKRRAKTASSPKPARPKTPPCTAKRHSYGKETGICKHCGVQKARRGDGIVPQAAPQQDAA